MGSSDSGDNNITDILDAVDESINAATDYSMMAVSEMQEIAVAMNGVNTQTSVLSTDAVTASDLIIELAQASEDLFSYASHISMSDDISSDIACISEIAGEVSRMALELRTLLKDIKTEAVGVAETVEESAEAIGAGAEHVKELSEQIDILAGNIGCLEKSV